MPGLSQSEATDIATEAYAYAYPLVTMEYTRRGFTNVPAPEDTKAPMGQIRPPAHLPERRIPRRDRAERRHALHPGLVRRVEGAVDRHRPGHGRPLLPAADAGRLDQRLRLAGHPQRRRQAADVRDHRARLARHACRPTCWSTSRRPPWCGCWAASTARAPRRITTRCTSCRIRSPRRRCRRSASPTCRRSPRSARRST